MKNETETGETRDKELAEWVEELYLELIEEAEGGK